ncbi:MAG: DUF4157 domain-containing protein [Nitrospirales bacterium]|nr:DUF4157 domain-containing protein [Nitrospirales bacterium]
MNERATTQKSQPFQPSTNQARGILQRKCASCSNHTMAGGACAECTKKKSGLQRKLAIGASSDPLEREADRVAAQVLATPTDTAGTNELPRIQRFTGHAAGQTGLAPASVDRVLASSGRPLETSLQREMGQGFSYDFSRVRVHTGATAEQSARDVNAHAYTVGHNIVFGAGRFAPETNTGRRLIAHELTHVVQQASYDELGSNNYLRRQTGSGGRTRTAPVQKLEFRPAMHPSLLGGPCACLVFIHNDERNARRAAEDLHRNCRYNLAIIGPGRSRTVPIRGSTRRIDPNELFPQDIQEECTRDQAGCVAYERSHNDLRAMQIQFFLTIQSCSNNFKLPTIALHNNSIRDTSGFLRGTSSAGRKRLRGDFSRETDEGTVGREELRSRLGRRRGIMSRSGTTNIFRWCNLPEISRCHIGDPDHPNDVVWVTNVQDFERLRQEDINVVLQEGLDTTSGSESETDLSTLFLRLGADARYINIETPITPQDQVTRNRNMSVIQQVLEHIGLNCCEPIGDFPTPSRTEMIA